MARYARLFYTRGLPGAGKTTVAREMVEKFIKDCGVTRVNRDDFRRMFHGRRLGTGRQEQLVTAAQDAAILALLELETDVFVDDTNLTDSQCLRLERLAKEAGARAQVVDLRDVPLEECLRRNRLRTGDAVIPEQVIVEKYKKYIAVPRATAEVAAAAGRARARG